MLQSRGEKTEIETETEKSFKTPWSESCTDQQLQYIHTGLGHIEPGRQCTDTHCDWQDGSG